MYLIYLRCTLRRASLKSFSLRVKVGMCVKIVLTTMRKQVPMTLLTKKWINNGQRSSFSHLEASNICRERYDKWYVIICSQSKSISRQLGFAQPKQFPKAIHKKNGCNVITKLYNHPISNLIKRTLPDNQDSGTYFFFSPTCFVHFPFCANIPVGGKQI